MATTAEMAQLHDNRVRQTFADSEITRVKLIPVSQLSNSELLLSGEFHQLNHVLYPDLFAGQIGQPKIDEWCNEVKWRLLAKSLTSKDLTFKNWRDINWWFSYKKLWNDELLSLDCELKDIFEKELKQFYGS